MYKKVLPHCQPSAVHFECAKVIRRFQDIVQVLAYIMWVVLLSAVAGYTKVHGVGCKVLS
jgi:hypothetical protein